MLLLSEVLNEGQLSAVRHILVGGWASQAPPPLVLYGPFGTGKTETLAQATMALLRTHAHDMVS